jgi:hypothetical protein
MKSKLITLGTALFVAATLGRAATIPIPDGSFEDISGVVKSPLLGINTGEFGTWAVAFTNLLALGGGQIASGDAADNDWITPANGAYEVQLQMPVSAAGTVSLSQNLTNQLQPNSQYTLSVDLSQTAVLSLASGTSLNLFAGTNGASLDGSTLATVLGSSSGYQTASLTYRTGNAVPTNAIGISLVIDETGVAGDLYIDNFQLSVVPVEIQVNSSIVPAGGGNQSISLNGSGGAPGATYEVMSSTNLLAPFSDWAIISTNHFDANGNFSLSFTVNPNTPSRYYKTMVPQ